MHRVKWRLGCIVLVGRGRMDGPAPSPGPSATSAGTEIASTHSWVSTNNIILYHITSIDAEASLNR